jgi:glycosyltransferase involved in cell wall biosynthesis
MNLCFLCREYPPAPRTGGIGSATRDQARALVRLGHRVHVVAPAWEGPGTFHDEGVLVHRVAARRWQLPGIARFVGQTLDRLAWARTAAREVGRIHGTEGLDLVEAPEFAGESVLAVRRDSPPVVVRLHTPLALVRRLNGSGLSRDCRLTVRLERAAIARAAAVTAPSRAIAAACAELGYPSAASARIIPYGIDTALFHPAAQAGNGAGDGRPLVLFAGRLEARKGIGDLARALPSIAARVPETRFAFVGADTPTAPGNVSWRDYLTAEARAAGIENRVELPGFVPRHELAAWYRAARVVVAPSPFENLALVFLEALASGRPLVGCAAGAFPEVVTDGLDGRAVPPRDPQALADAVVGLVQDPATAEEMGRRARRRAEEAFAWDAVAAESADFYAEVARGSRR